MKVIKIKVWFEDGTDVELKESEKFVYYMGEYKGKARSIDFKGHKKRSDSFHAKQVKTMILRDCKKMYDGWNEMTALRCENVFPV